MKDLDIIPAPVPNHLRGLYIGVKASDVRALLAVAREVVALREALSECADWLETRPDATEGDAATASRARAKLKETG